MGRSQETNWPVGDRLVHRIDEISQLHEPWPFPMGTTVPCWSPHNEGQSGRAYPPTLPKPTNPQLNLMQKSTSVRAEPYPMRLINSHPAGRRHCVRFYMNVFSYTVCRRARTHPKLHKCLSRGCRQSWGHHFSQETPMKAGQTPKHQHRPKLGGKLPQCRRTEGQAREH